MKKMHILLLGALPILLLLVTCAQETPTSVSPIGVDQTEINALSKANNQEVRWDIVTVNFPFLNPGGSASALAEDDSKITLTGSGTFEVDDEPHDDVTGGGTWMTSSGSGTYEVTNFVSFHAEPVGTAPFPPLTDNIGDPADATAGLVYLTIEYSDGSQGVLVVGCSFAGSPSETMGGITASKGPVNFWNRLAASPPTNENLTIFHFNQDDDDDDDDDGDDVPDISAAPTRVDFGKVAVGSSKDKTFVLKNDGASDLKINKAQVAGSNAEQYAVLDLDIPAVLAPGESREVTVRFSPTSSGIKKGQVKLFSNDPDENHFPVSFKGTGIDDL